MNQKINALRLDSNNFKIEATIESIKAFGQHSKNDSELISPLKNRRALPKRYFISLNPTLLAIKVAIGEFFTS